MSICIKSLFGKWHETTYEDALDFAIEKLIALQIQSETRMYLINDRLRGIQFTFQDVYDAKNNLCR